MTTDYRYFNNEAGFLPVAQAALAAQFEAPADFAKFYAALKTPAKKSQFLRVACFYYYLVRQGDWMVQAPDTNPVVDYLTNSYKVVGLFALIESLSEESHEDFQEWLLKRPFSSMHRPDIASVIADTVVLDGTTVEEVERYHRDTLMLAVDTANAGSAALVARREQEIEAERRRLEAHRNNVSEVAKRLRFGDETDR